MRGGVYRYKPSGQQGHEQHGTRFAVVVQASDLDHWGTWLVVPTSTRARGFSFRPVIEVQGQRTLALCDALVSLDPERRLAEMVGYLPPESMSAISAVLRRLLDL